MYTATLSEVQSQLGYPLGRKQTSPTKPRSADRPALSDYSKAVKDCRQALGHARDLQERVAQMPCDTPFARRASECFARVAAALSDFFYSASDEVATHPRSKMLADSLEELGVVYEDIAESHALAASVDFARRVEEELAGVARETA